MGEATTDAEGRYTMRQRPGRPRSSWRRRRRHTSGSSQAAAEELADTNALGALELLNQKPDWSSQRPAIAGRSFAETDPRKAVLFANEAAVRSRGLNHPDRALAMASARS